MHFTVSQKENSKYPKKHKVFKNERKDSMLKKQFTAIVLCLIACLNIVSPVYAVLPDTLTERTNEYTVKIQQGDGKIMVNKESSVKTFTNPYVSYTVNYIDATPEDFNETGNIELTVREGETVKNRLEYSKAREDVADENAYDWANEAFVTSTRVVRSILANGLNTYIYNSPNGQSGKNQAEALAGSLGGIIYPRDVTKAYLFVPNSDELVFSHFVDQNGNAFDISSYVTENLVLTPVYKQADEVASDTFFNSVVHQVTILPGEGRIQKFTGDEDYYDGNPQRYIEDEEFEDLEKITFVVKDGDTKMTDITTPYARLKWNDIEKAEEFLKKSRKTFLKYIDEGQGKEAISSLEEMIDTATTDIWWTSSINITSTDENFNATREYGYSLFFLLGMWTEMTDEKSLADELNALFTEAKNYDELSSAEREDLFNRAKGMVDKLTNAWDSFVAREYENSASWYQFYTDARFNGFRYNESIFEAKDSLADRKGILRIRTPDSEYDCYNFDHFVDQDGNVFDLGDPVTKDLVLTPIFTDWRESKHSTVTGNISVITEDKSNEKFEVKLTQQTGDFLKYENKSNYTFDETLWDINPNGQITNYKGELGLIGIPDTVNGITVKSLSAKTFEQLFNRYNGSEYIEETCAVWIPATVTELNVGLSEEDLMGQVKDILVSEGEYEETADCISIATNGKNDFTALSYLPDSYVVVDKENQNYTSLRGSLYNKKMTTLYYLSVNAGDEENMTVEERIVYDIPSSVKEISAFATYKGLTFARRWFVNCYSKNLEINNYLISIDVNADALRELYQQKGEDMSEEQIKFIIEYISNILNDNGISQFYNIFYNARYARMTVLPERESTATNAIRKALFEMYKLYYSDASDSEINEEIESILPYFVIQGGGLKNYADRIGEVAEDSPYEPTFIRSKGNGGHYYGDTFSYSVELINLPKRYKPVDVQYIHPNQKDWVEGFEEEPIPELEAVFRLELKKGKVNIISTDADTGAKIDATYLITDTDNNVIDTVSSASEAASITLPYGTYMITQTTIKPGYGIAEPQTFSITEDGQIVNVKFENRAGCQYSVRVPKAIMLDGSTGTGEYKVGVSGMIGQDMKVSILPAPSFKLSQNGKSDIIANASQNKTVWISTDISVNSWSTATGIIRAPLTAGTWKGSIGFTIIVE